MVADNDGVIETGEKVYLFFGMGRGGDFYYAPRRQRAGRAAAASGASTARR